MKPKSGKSHILFMMLWMALLLTPSWGADDPGMVFTEIMYHPPDDGEKLEYIEIQNLASDRRDLSRWQIQGGIQYQFPEGTVIPGHGFLVICRDVETFRRVYECEASFIGGFKGRLNNSGEMIILSTPDGAPVDSVFYSDQSPWPMAPDGYGSSLERISVKDPACSPYNWRSSETSWDVIKPSGTPGLPSKNSTRFLPPIISDIKWTPESPKIGESIHVEANVSFREKLQSVELLYRICTPGSIGEEMAISMRSASAGDVESVHQGDIPGQGKETLIRFRVRAVVSKDEMRIEPDPTDLRPYLSCYVVGDTVRTDIPRGFLMHLDDVDFRRGQEKRKTRIWSREQAYRHALGVCSSDGVDLEGTWMLLCFTEDLSPDIYDKAMNLFAEMFARREKALDQIIQARYPEVALKSFADSINDIKSEFKMNMESSLSVDLCRRLEQAYLESRTRETVNRREPRYIKDKRSLLDLEAMWFYFTVICRKEQSQIDEMKALFKKAEMSRSEIFRELRTKENICEDWWRAAERGLDLERSVMRSVNAALTEEQAKGSMKWLADHAQYDGTSIPARQDSRARGDCAFIFIERGEMAAAVYDYIDAIPRGGGYKIKFHRDKPLKIRMNNFSEDEGYITTANLIIDANPGGAIFEPISFELYRRANIPAPLSLNIRSTVDSENIGYGYLVEQPNTGFLIRNGWRRGGNLYKSTWNPYDVGHRYEKKTNLHENQDDILNLVQRLEISDAKTLWKMMSDEFDPDEIARYYAVNFCLSHWDGYFNNYFMYNEPGEEGRWHLIPWDPDRTWGIFGLRNVAGRFADMPMSFGGKGDLPPGFAALPYWGEKVFRGPGVPAWWRPPGDISGPLLANDEFRKLVIEYLRDMLKSEFSEGTLQPLLASREALMNEEALEYSLKSGRDPDYDLKVIKNQFQALRQYIMDRRTYLEKHLEMETVRLRTEMGESAE
ncbi:MAG: CotH kinase family protein [Candidatus Eisenbacteria bacterium]|uniref:CotH kinase family protein n=1 Tax=Eiseniibacteriota bacterium TaxID=2212470 RepID=A0A948RWT0_UNCEI|nr:CotH kinase family protein [Candidatus Eisenbacteria bacterium]MBU1948449.1 CotH kinase family protein [Candidatus Eisenbacteria bacterium]MBU2692480.1 CotH kinase family protein [Candidatus Eisenbacteria bacterium]